MKVLYCYRYGVLGGVCTQLINRLQVLDGSQGLEAHLVFAKDYGVSRTLNGYPFLHFEPDVKKVQKMAASGRFSAVVVIDTPEYLEALSNVRGVPLITEVHTTYEHGLKYLEDRRWATSGYIVPSEYSRNLLRERFAIGRDEPVHIVPNSLDARLFPRENTGRPGPRPVFAWVGKLDDHKNWRGFLAFGACISERGVDAEYWLIGGETAPPERHADVIDEIERLGLCSRCRWFPRIEYRAMHCVYGAVRESGGAAVVTSINESFGMSVLEAVMCGCPVVASRVGAIPEIAPGRSYLRLYELGQLDEAADVALDLLEPDESRRVREEIDGDHAWLLASYSREAVAAKYLAALRDLIARSA
ncbi:MAG: glycosyltransferase family 4 protein [Phycisphaerae bacterium]|nr:glycosyltransferase family 4 protein [Phycisphaerae bacterium]